jgi:hypothetical protein
MTSKSKTKIANFRPRGANGRFIKAPTKASVAETTPAVEAPVVTEAPKAEAQVFAIPDLGKGDLVMGPQGFHQLPGKTWYRLTTMFGKPTIRQAIAIMVTLELRLPLAVELARWQAFRPHMLAQLKAVADNKDVLNVLEWVWNNQGFTWREAYEVFPRAGFPGCAANKSQIGKFNKLVSLLDAIRKEGKTSIRAIDYLAQACHLLGWIN